MSTNCHPAEQFLHSVLVAGTRLSQHKLALDGQDKDVQALLQRARGQYSYALCCCRPSQQLRLQVRSRSGKSHLAVWPEEGPQHDVQCIFFRDEMTADAPEPHAPGQNGGELAEATPGPELPTYAQTSTRTRVRLVRPGQERIPGEQGLSVRSLAYRLWHTASLCRWHPTWTRDWGRVRYQLHKAAKHFSLDGHNAERLLFVPRVYRPDVQAQVDGEWDSFVRCLQNEPDRPHLLIAQAREFTQASGDKPGVLRLRHLRHPIGLHPACHDFLLRECRSALGNCRLGVAPELAQGRPDLVAVLSVDANSRGGVWARSGWLLGVHQATYVPAANSDSVRLIEALLRERHVFEHLLSELQSSQRHASDWLVRHVYDASGQRVSRAALEILSAGSTPQFVRARNEIAKRMQQQGIPTWTWVPSGRHNPVPSLPPVDTATPAKVQASLDAIRTSAGAEYRYGALNRLFSHHQFNHQHRGDRTFE
jgi:hypothetical protein